jgi:hypothetical protein
MANKGNPSSAGKSQTDGKPKEKSSKTSAKNGALSKPDDKLKRKIAENKKDIKPEVVVAIWVAVIGSITTIVTTIVLALPGLLPFIPSVQPRLTPTATLSSTPFITNSPELSLTNTPTPVILPSITNTPAVTVIATDAPIIQASPAPVLIPRLVANKTSGRSPLIVKFDARDSFLRESDGTQLSCQAGTCYYTWRVLFNLQAKGNSVNNSSGKFEYTFRERGTYTVTVYICRGQDRVDCADSAIWIVVTR